MKNVKAILVVIPALQHVNINIGQIVRDINKYIFLHSSHDADSEIDAYFKIRISIDCRESEGSSVTSP